MKLSELTPGSWYILKDDPDSVRKRQPSYGMVSGGFCYIASTESIFIPVLIGTQLVWKRHDEDVEPTNGKSILDQYKPEKRIKCMYCSLKPGDIFMINGVTYMISIIVCVPLILTLVQFMKCTRL